MQVGILVVLLSGLVTGGRGQGFDAQQLLLDWQKLAQLKQLLNDMYKGYAIVEKGYTAIRDISHGSFDLHKLFLDGLLVVSPSVRDYFKVAEVLALQQQMVREYGEASSRLRADKHFRIGEIADFGRVYGSLLGESERTLDALLIVLTDGQLRATDGERMRDIDRLHVEMTGQLIMMRQLNNETAMRSLQRARDAADADEVRRLYGINH